MAVLGRDDVGLDVVFGTDETIRFLATVDAVISFATAIDGAADKRIRAVLEWIEYQKTKDKPSGIDSALLIP